MSFPQRRQFDKHVKNKHEKKDHEQFNYENCIFQGSSKEEFLKHQKVTHLSQSTHKEDNNFNCHACQKLFISKSDLMQHRKLDHPQIVKTCKYFIKGNCAYKNNICWYKHDN